MSNFQSNINGCLEYKDYPGAIIWLNKAKESLDIDGYSNLILSLEKRWTSIFDSNEFSSFKSNVINLDSCKKSIIELLEASDYVAANNIFKQHFTLKTFPEYFTLLEKYKKENLVKDLHKSVKENLSDGEKELFLDMKTHLSHQSKNSHKRIKSDTADFYITKSSNYGLSIYKDNDRTVRHLPWNHVFSREILSADLGEEINSNFGKVSLICDFTPIENDLSDVKYFSLNGRSHFSSALDTLTGDVKLLDSLIDVENFMDMKEVIPTSSQMKAIYAEGNYIIDGPAGTGKSTTLLQKLLILTSKDNVKNKDIVVLVKHDGLVEPFKRLLLDMEIKDVKIASVSEFLLSEYGNHYDEVSLDDIEKNLYIVEKTNEIINVIFNERSSDKNISDLFPVDLINERIILKDLKSYYKTKNEEESLKQKIRDLQLKIRKPIEDAFSEECINIEKEINSLENRINHCRGKGLRLDKKTLAEIKELSDSLEINKKLKDDSPESDREGYESIISSLKAQFEIIESNAKYTDIHGYHLHLSDYITSKIEDEVEEIISTKRSALPSKISTAHINSKALTSLKKKHVNTVNLIKSSEKKIKELIWNKALIVTSTKQKKLINFIKNSGDLRKFNTIIIDEAQDVPSSFIEMVNFYTGQLILAGDEAQKENPDGLGLWSNLSDNIGFKARGEISTYKLKHNFRQTYELGRLSYNYRQLILGHKTENLEADYFENQKGFNVPVIDHIDNFDDMLKDKLNYISKSFTKKFPLVIISNDVCQQNKLVKKIESKNMIVSVDQDSVEADVIVLCVNKVAGREFPVVISMLNKKMDDSTVYIILSRAKFDMTLVVNDFKDIDFNLKELNAQSMIEIKENHVANHKTLSVD